MPAAAADAPPDIPDIPDGSDAEPPEDAEAPPDIPDIPDGLEDDDEPPDAADAPPDIPDMPDGSEAEPPEDADAPPDIPDGLEDDDEPPDAAEAPEDEDEPPDIPDGSEDELPDDEDEPPEDEEEPLEDDDDPPEAALAPEAEASVALAPAELDVLEEEEDVDVELAESGPFGEDESDNALASFFLLFFPLCFEEEDESEFEVMREEAVSESQIITRTHSFPPICAAILGGVSKSLALPSFVPQPGPKHNMNPPEEWGLSLWVLCMGAGPYVLITAMSTATSMALMEVATGRTQLRMAASAWQLGWTMPRLLRR